MINPGVLGNIIAQMSVDAGCVGWVDVDLSRDMVYVRIEMGRAIATCNFTGIDMANHGIPGFINVVKETIAQLKGYIHGQHRRAGAQVQVSAPGQSSSGDNGAHGPAPSAYSGPGAGQSSNIAQSWAQVFPFQLGDSHREFRSDPPQAGEVMAWRCWRVAQNGIDGPPYIVSTFMTCEWPLGGHLKTTPVDYPPGDHSASDPDLLHGIHAWKTRDQARRYARNFGATIALGQVKLWGDIFEHEEGYRAEYASVHSIHEVHRAGPAVLQTAFWHQHTIRRQPARELLRRLQLQYGGR